MTNNGFLLKILPILSPVFYTLKDKEDNEFVFLNAGDKLRDISNRKIDKTQCEAIENHFHIFNRINANKKMMRLRLEKRIRQF